MRCIMCGMENDSHMKFCGRCRTKLPDLPPGIMVKPPSSLLSFLRKLKSDALESTKEKGELGESFLKIQNHLENTREKYVAKKETLEHSTAAQRAEETIAALEEFIAAVREMSSYMDDGDQGHLVGGLNLAEMADLKFQDTLGDVEKEVVSVFRQKTYYVEPG
jgi:hypothetical protein